MQKKRAQNWSAYLIENNMKQKDLHKDWRQNFCNNSYWLSINVANYFFQKVPLNMFEAILHMPLTYSNAANWLKVSQFMSKQICFDVI